MDIPQLSEKKQLARIVVLISGNGSNLQAMIDACASGRIPAQIVFVVSNHREAYGLVRAQLAGIATAYHPLKPYRDAGRGRCRYDADLADLVAAKRPDWVALAGWMHLLGMSFLSRFPGRVINLHPALPGQYPGAGAIVRAYEAYQRGEISCTGAMIHLVPDEGCDTGPTIMTQHVPIVPEDTLESLEERVHRAEHRLYVEALRRLIAGGANGPASN